MARIVLVVEDDFDTQHPLAELLRLKGYTVLTASNVELALKKAREHQPNLIITDIVLPGKSGLQLIYNVRSDEKIQDIPILVISGCEPSILEDAKGVGANFCLPKPLQVDAFWETLSKVLQTPNEELFVWKAVTDQTSGNTNAVVIDNLLDELDHCASENERDEVLKRLKEQILNLQTGNEDGLRV